MNLKNCIKGILIVIPFMAPSATFAQHLTQHEPLMEHDSPIPEMSPKEKTKSLTKWMQKNLLLTDEQNSKVHDILLHYFQQAENVRDLSGHNSKATEMQSLNIQRDVNVKEVLKGEQYMKYHDHMQDLQQSIDDHRAGGEK